MGGSLPLSFVSRHPLVALYSIRLIANSITKLEISYSSRKSEPVCPHEGSPCALSTFEARYSLASANSRLDVLPLFSCRVMNTNAQWTMDHSLPREIVHARAPLVGTEEPVHLASNPARRQRTEGATAGLFPPIHCVLVGSKRVMPLQWAGGCWQ